MKEDIFYEKFISAIDEKKLVKIGYFNKFGKLLSKICIPFDYGIKYSYKDLQNRYFLYEYNKDYTTKELHIKTSDLYFIEHLEETFCPISLGLTDKQFLLLRNW